MKKDNMQKVCIQGLGFVGSAMAIAVSNAKDEKNHLIPCIEAIKFRKVKDCWDIQ